jgi:hypothetical protein
MPPRITAESCRPRVSDRTMRYHLEWITMTACQFREAEWRRYNNGDMKTHHWKAAESRNFRCDEKRPGTRTNAHGSRVFTRTLTRARMPRQKSVGVEPEGELFLLTFLFIGPSELFSLAFPLPIGSGSRLIARPLTSSTVVSPIATPRTPDDAI